MHDYLLYVHNLKGYGHFDSFKVATRNAILSYFINPLATLNELEQNIVSETSEEVLTFIAGSLDLKSYFRSILLTTPSSSYVDSVDFNNVRAIINLQLVNQIQHPNQHFRSVNSLLPDGGIYIGRLETYGERKDVIYRQVGHNNLGRAFWMLDFLLHRLIPRIPILEDLYFKITKGKFRAISSAEVLGRLVYCGFEIIDMKAINGLSYFVVMKTREPSKLKNPSYYPLIRLNRIGKDGKNIKVYKFRTMHPYSEFIQDYVIKLNGYNDKGKPALDFRVTRWGLIFRKLWLDEIPQLINVFTREMKLVGLRPLSKVRFDEFPEDLKKERIKYKPGCFPPYVALNMPDEKMNIEAERIYLRDLKAHPYTTDFRYFLKSVYNIMLNKIRSS